MQINKFTLSGMKNLKYLDLQNSRLDVIRSGMFEGIEQLVMLDISNSNIRVVQDGVLSTLKGLRFLNVSKYRFYNLPFTYKIYLKNLSNVHTDHGIFCCPVYFPNTANPSIFTCKILLLYKLISVSAVTLGLLCQIISAFAFFLILTNVAPI